MAGAGGARGWEKVVGSPAQLFPEAPLCISLQSSGRKALESLFSVFPFSLNFKVYLLHVREKKMATLFQHLTFQFQSSDFLKSKRKCFTTFKV